MTAAVRVYELADELGVSSTALVSDLRQQGHPVRSASTLVTEEFADSVRAGTSASFRAPRSASQGAILAPVPKPVDVEMTTAEAAESCRVSEATIRQWVRRGYLAPAGRRGRSHTFMRSAVWRAKDEVFKRTPRSVHTPRMFFGPQYVESLITDTEAASLLGLSQSTIRKWVGNGRLTPTGSSRPRLFRVGDVMTAARDYRPD